MPSSIKELIEKNASRPAIARVWQRFAEISKIPRLSGNEAGVRDYLVGFARDRKLAHEIDAVGNVLIEIPATHGWENVFGAILQAHMDMVCVHDQGFPDPAVKGVVPLVDEAKEWVYARGTSLGADNAIGLAIALALVDDPEITHGPLKIMATVDEEQGLQGASKISFKDLDTGNDKYLINLDSEDFGEVYIGCAGGGDSVISLPIEREAISNKTILGLKLEGLAGGHSGMAIANGGKNAIKEMARILRQLHGHAEFQIVSLNSGERRNVIPSSGVAVVAVDHHLVAEFTAKAESISKDQAVTDEQIKVSVERFEGVGSGSGMLTRQTTLTLIEILSKLPHGVIRWDEKIIGLPMTSTNLATVSTDDEEMLISLMSRSSVTDELESVR
ncbi:MAG: M20/M25/M40 family metallo-hydrolase, partial [Candidatus Pacebacteria bacterium]|nr:M20/M25/M40 family metallo-hydrolase [Candidatus Paceibacterota bacterium]